jgi:hypothetical protein
LLRRPIPGGASHPRSGYSVALGSPVDPPTHALILDAAELVVAAEKARRDLIAGKGDIALVARFSQIEGYKCFSLTRALDVVKCQLALV